MLGICNGFQVLLEAGLLPGAMLRNREPASSAASTSTCASSRPTRRSPPRARAGQVLRIPIAHGEGNYYATPDVIARLEAEPAGRLPLRRRRRRASTDEANPNGSVNNIAGICNEARNVVGLMPHPERACELALGSADGLVAVRVGR